MKTAVIIANLGTPKELSMSSLKEYLREFLMDPRVISLPFVFRWPLVNTWIVPRRAPSSFHAYQKIWTKRGSPLLYHSEDLQKKLQKSLGDDYTVFLGMRYAEPSIESQLEKVSAGNFNRVLLLPLYPQYAEATTGSSFEVAQKWLRKNSLPAPLEVLIDFYEDSNYINNVVDNGKQVLQNYSPDHVLISFHGLPQKALQEGLGKGHCYQSKDCCFMVSDKNTYCYRSQSLKTAHWIAEKLGLNTSQYTACFQSRLGRSEWIQPYTLDSVIAAAKGGKKRLLVFSPAFVADCLETLEEIEIGLRETFIEHGGEDLRLVPSLNADDAWVETLTSLVKSNGFETLNDAIYKLGL